MLSRQDLAKPYIDIVADRSWEVTTIIQPKYLLKASSVFHKSWNIYRHQEPLCNIQVESLYTNHKSLQSGLYAWTCQKDLSCKPWLGHLPLPVVFDASPNLREMLLQMMKNKDEKGMSAKIHLINLSRPIISLGLNCFLEKTKGGESAHFVNQGQPRQNHAY